MLSFNLRAAWFCLSLIGTTSCWIVLVCFCRAVEAYWPLVYCVGCTLTNVIFCLGMIYKMDPFLMPYSFCAIQSIFIGLGVFIMTGTGATFAMATTYASYKPKTWRNGRKGIMIWRPVYSFTLFIFPLVATAIQTAATFKLDGRGRSDDLHCDYSDPTWIRFLSYAGTPFILTIPCLYFSITSIIRIHKTNQHIERSRDPGMDIGTLTSMPRRPQRTQHVRIARASSNSSRPSSPPVASRQTSSPTLTENRGSRIYPITSLDAHRSSVSSIRTEETTDSRVSSSFPTFSSHPHMGTVSVDPDRITISTIRPGEEWREALTHAPCVDIDKIESVKWAEDGDKVDFEYGKTNDDLAAEDDRSEITPPHYTPRRNGDLMRKPRNPIASLSPSIYRVIFFQTVFSILQSITPITTIIDVAKGRTPAAFGSQHIALLLSSWGPVFVFIEWQDLRRCIPWAEWFDRRRSNTIST